MSKPYKCPICNGTGNVPFNFYNDKENTTTAGNIEKCRTCLGYGVLWSKDVEFEYHPPKQIESYDPCKNCSVRLNPNWNGVCHCVLPLIVNPPVRW